MSSKLAKQLLNEFSTVFDDVSIKTFFSGFSVNSKNTIFGWINQSKFYLRGHPSYRDQFIELGMHPLVLSSGVITKLLDYYQVDDALYDDRPKLYAMINMVIKCAEQDRQNKHKIKELRIKELPNMTLSLERLLCSVGISDVKTFQTLGYLESFHRIKEKRKAISINILFILYSALNKIHVAVLSPATKKEIESSYQRFLE